ncbi:MAG: proline--tRNA ligase [Clostridiales bacterium]|jgi:prolyl-tRNA synthetase|nr:proline--tRNA ligase [Clostridiales bacterium]
MADLNFVKEIADIDSDFTQWYTDVILKTRLVDYGPVKGTMVIRPYGYSIWEIIQAELNARFKATGHFNAYFPLLIPQSFLMREAEHVEGFAPECAMVTHVGKEPLAEPLVIRPTSETIICEMYSKWIQSWRDLPVKYNQWANVLRWEKTTRPFLRTSEFLWQEGHTVHATAEEAQAETIQMLGVYEEFCKTVLAMPVITGRKSEKEKFAGAAATYSIEAMMLDGKSLQAGTSHFLGENFAKAFDIKFLDKDNKLKYGNQSSWGVSTRLIGALIMVHGDGRGLKLPPRVAPYQVVIVPIATHKAGVTEAAREISAGLQKVGVRVYLDERDMSPGWKFNEWEMKGVPCRIEVGPRDLETGTVSVMRRDTLEKSPLAVKDVKKGIPSLLNKIQRSMYAKASAFMKSNIVKARTLKALGNAVNSKKFALSMWCGDPKCEAHIKETFQATSRNMPFDQTPIADRCVVCGKSAKFKIYFAKAY